MFKKIAVLAMATGVLAALALPTLASAAWKHEQTPITENKAIGLTGTAAFTSPLGGVTCQVTSEAQFKADQTTGEIETFDIHPQDETTDCKGTGLLAPCQIHNVSPQTNLNWSFHTTGTVATPDIQITTQDLTSTLTGAFCGVKHINLTAGKVIAQPNQQNKVTNLTLSGTLQGHLQTKSGVVDTVETEVSHFLTIESPNEHTYSI